MRSILLALIALLSTGVRAQQLTEEISRFSVDISVRQDGTLYVVETVTVVATGDEIKRGITRALNVDPLGDADLAAPLTYEVLAVTRNEEEEPFRVRQKRGMPTIYIGDKEKNIPPGTYTYEIRYRAANQVYPVGVTDEIRWPLEGKVSRFPVREADITLRFERDLQILQSACYTGTFGSTATDCDYSQDGNVVTFVATRGLQPGEGMTVSASVSQGYFTRPVPPPPPTPFERRAALYSLVIGLALASGYAYSMWRKYGVDPEGPPVKHEYYPPQGLSPAAVGYYPTSDPMQNGVTASLATLSIAGYLAITEEEGKGMFFTYERFTVSPTDKVPPPGTLPAEQRVLYDGIVAADGLTLDGEYNKAIGELTEAHKKALVEAHKPFIEDGATYRGMLPLFGILLTTLGLGLYFVITTGFGKPAFLIALFVATCIFGFYAYLIQQPSLAKVTLLNKIKGLKQYLMLPEKKRKALPNAPEMTPEYFQAVLPYAIALGIENDWADDLAADWANTGQQVAGGGFVLASPFLLAGFGSRFGQNFGQTAAHPATGGGGGFSGGGGSVGGGGGTGGW